jgi:WD40 repeat protein
MLQELVLTGSADHTLRVWGVQQTAPCAHVIRAHDGPVTGLSLHATGDYLLSCATDAVSNTLHRMLRELLPLIPVCSKVGILSLTDAV